MRIVAGKFVVDAYLDGQGPFAIAIDSGAETLIITPHVARACRFPLLSGTVAVTGTQSRTPLAVAQAQVGSIRIGGARVAKPFCTVSPTSLSVDGYIGAPLLNAFVTELDPQAHVVRLYRPESFASILPDGAPGSNDEAAARAAAARAAAQEAARVLGQSAANSNTGVVVLQSDGTPIPPAPLPVVPPPSSNAPAPPVRSASAVQFGIQVPITLGFHRVPVAQGTLGGLAARLELDTGSSFPAELTGAFVRRSDLARRFDRMGSVQLQSGGVVGRAGIYAFDDLTLGAVPHAPGQSNDGVQSGTRLTGTIPTLFLASTGQNEAPDHVPQYDGRIGAPLLVQFAVTFDYARSRVFLRPVQPSEVLLPRVAQPQSAL